MSAADTLGLAVALLLNHSIRGRGLFRTILFIPVITPIVILGFASLSGAVLSAIENARSFL